MKKYVIAILVTMLVVTIGVYQVQQIQQVQSKTETQNKYKLQSVTMDTKKNVTMCDAESKPINPKTIKEKENNKYIIMETTAYDLSKRCCGKSYSSPSRGITRDGYNLTRKSHKQALTVASTRFPMGTKLKLIFPESHKQYNGVYTVRDTGNFKENVLDVYVGDYGEKVHKDTIGFGRVKVKVEVIK